MTPYQFAALGFACSSCAVAHIDAGAPGAADSTTFDAGSGNIPRGSDAGGNSVQPTLDAGNRTVPRGVDSATLDGGAAGAMTGGADSATVQTSDGSARTTVAVAVQPPSAYLAPGGSQSFTCSVTGATDKTCTWSVVGGASNGTITSAGVYSAPQTLGIAQVVAVSRADATARGTASVVVQAMASGATGVWTNVTPRALNLSGGAFGGDNFGVQDVVVDPVRPTDLYTFVCYQGVWKSTDYGATWKGPINTGSGGGLVTAGKPWTGAIDPTLRDPATPPTLWTASGNSAVGVLRSTDGGVSWTAYATNNTTASSSSGNNYYANDAYAIDVDPYDGKHLITGFHGYPGISESLNGGTTWATVAVPGNIGASLYPFFVDTGTAKTTRTNWVTVSQDGGNNGTWHTANGGGSWSQVGKFDHFHGNSQLWNAGAGVAYVGATGGVYKTADGGGTWTQVNNVDSNGVVATPTTLYASFGWASNSGWDPHLQRAARSADGSWSAASAPSMSNGAKRVAVTFDGVHHILVAGSWNAGIWRYIE